MRHRKKTVILSRTPAHRRALAANLVSSLIIHEQVTTTVAKAKAFAPLAEKMITLAKKGTLAARRRAIQVLRDKAAVAKLFSDLGPRFAARSGGYTRILKLAFARKGDGAPLARLMLTELSPAASAPKAPAKGKAKKEKVEKTEKAEKAKAAAPAEAKKEEKAAEKKE